MPIAQATLEAFSRSLSLSLAKPHKGPSRLRFHSPASDQEGCLFEPRFVTRQKTVANSLNLLIPSTVSPAALRLGDPVVPAVVTKIPESCIADRPCAYFITRGTEVEDKAKLEVRSVASNLSESEKASARAFLELSWAGKSGPAERGFPTAFPAAQGCGALAKVTPQEEARVPAPLPQPPPPSSRSLGLFLQAGAPAPLPGFPRGGISRLPPPSPPPHLPGHLPARPCPSTALGPGAGPRQSGGGGRGGREPRPRRGSLPPSRCPLPLLSALPPLPRPSRPPPPPRRARSAWQLAPRAWGRGGERGLQGGRERVSREGERPPPRAPPPRPPPRPTVPPPAPSLLLPPPSLAKTSPHGPAAAATFPAPSCRCGGAAGRRAAAPGEPAPREPRARAPARPGPPPRPPPAVPRPPEPAAGASQPGRRGSCLKTSWVPSLTLHITMHSLDEPLDLKLSITKLRAAREKRERTLGVVRHHALHRELGLVDDSPTPGSPGSPPPGFLLNPKFPEKVDGRFSTAPLVDLSLSPPSGLDSPNGSSSLSPERQGSGDLPPLPTAVDFQPLRYLDGVPSSFQFFLPLGSGGALHLPASSFLTPPKDKCLSPELPLAKQLVCRWAKCNQLFELLQDLVDHVNDHHVKPEQDARYCCHWEGCARHGRGFNARYKMLIHIRTHTNEKPHRCPTCNKSFSRLENLKIHNRSHTGEKPYVCPYEGCNKRYSNSSDRFKHTRTHYVDKPYYCKMPGCHKRYTDPSSLRKHIKAHGHFVSQEQQELLQLRPPPKPPLPTPDSGSYVSGAQIIIPNPAALFGGPSLPGLPLPLAPGPLDLSALACGNGGGGSGSGGMGPGLPGSVLPLNLAKNPLLPSPFGAGGLGLPVVSLLGGSAGSKAEGEKGRGSLPARVLGLEDHKTPLERTERSRSRPSPDGLPLLPGTVLDLSTGNSAASSPEALTPGWVVIPPGSVLLKPAVVN